jgi:hypothetical protein
MIADIYPPDGGCRYPRCLLSPFRARVRPCRDVRRVVKAAGYSQVNVWSVVYRADGFVGAVTIVGPDATAASAKKLASQACAYAHQSLS